MRRGWKMVEAITGKMSDYSIDYYEHGGPSDYFCNDCLGIDEYPPIEGTCIKCGAYLCSACIEYHMLENEWCVGEE